MVEAAATARLAKAENIPARWEREAMIPDIEHTVCNEIMLRQQAGIEKYGQTVAANPLELRGWLEHAYYEALDQAIYLRRAMAEMDERELEGDLKWYPT